MKYFIGLLIFLLVFFAGKTLISDSSAKPNKKAVAIELFGNDCCAKQTEYGKDDFEILDTQEFVFANKQYLSFFFYAKSYDKAGNLIDCHACSSKIAVVTYALKNSQWVLQAKQLNLMEMGSWGKPPDLSFRSIRFSEKLIGFFVPHSYRNMGISTTYEYLITFDGKNWQNSGVIKTSENNFGTCGGDSGLVCYGWTGQIGLNPKANHNYPDIILRRDGTDYVENSDNIDFVKDSIYQYDGKTYVLGITNKS